jgi:hypothetical protein
VTDRFDERLLAYVEGRASAMEREQLEQELATTPSLAAEMEQARRGLAALRALAATPDTPVPPIADSAWRRVDAEGTGGASTREADRRAGLRRAATIAALFLLPASGWFARGLVAPPQADLEAPPIPGVVTPPVINPAMQEYLLLFTGSWENLESLTPQERLQRQEEYMMWIADLEADDRYVAGGELGGDPGVFLTNAGMGVSAFVPDLAPEDIVVGFVYIRAESPEEARRIAEECPHVRYGSGVLLKGGGMPM